MKRLPTQVEFPDSLSPAAVETLEKVLPGRPVTEFDGEEEESMLEVSFIFNMSRIVGRFFFCSFVVRSRPKGTNVSHM